MSGRHGILLLAMATLVAVGIGLLEIPGEDSWRVAEADRPENPDGYARFRSMVRPHPEGTNITQLLLDAKREVDARPSLFPDKDAGLWNWEWLGPGNIGGRVRAVLTHPDEPGTLWAGSAGGGIWKTTNGGAGWYPLHDFLASLAVTSLAMDPDDPDLIYAGTGEGFGNSDGLPGAGVFRSYDGGGNWTQLADSVSPHSYFVNDIAHHPSTSGILLAATGTDSYFGSGYVMRSTDHGDNWFEVLQTPSTALDIKFDPDDPDVVIVGTRTGAFRNEHLGSPGFWVELSTGATGALPDDTGRCEIAFGKGTDVVYASCDLPTNDGEPSGAIYRSLDNGLTWSLRTDFDYLQTQGWYDNVIWAEPGSTENLLVGGVDMFKSTDGGANLIRITDWRQYHTGLSAHADQHAIVPHIDYGNGSTTIFVGNDGGVQAATLGLNTEPFLGWSNLANSLGITQFYHADVNATGTTILGGTQDNDDLRYRESEGAQNWYQAETGDGTFCAIDPTDESIMYGCYPLLEIQKSETGGHNYVPSYFGITDAGHDDRALFVSPFALDKKSPNRLFAGGRSIWISNSRATYWDSCLGPIPGNPLCSAIEITPHVGSGDVWVGYDHGQIWKSTNNGTDWTEVEGIGGVLPDNAVTDIEISPHDPQVVIVTFGGYLGNRVWRTADGGTNWSCISGTVAHSLPSIQVNCVTYHPSNQDWIYVGTDLGMFASEDMGENWGITGRYGTNEGPVYTEVSDLLWHSGNSLIAVTHGRGMYQCMPLDIVWVDGSHGGTEDGTIQYPWDTVTEGYDAMGNGATLIIRDGDYDENGIVFRKRVQIESAMGESAVIR